MQLILFFIFLNAVSSLKLTNTISDALLLPNTDNKIEPFTLLAETNSEKEATYTLEVVCSQNTKTNIVFSGKNPNICTTDEFTGTVDEINAILVGTIARLKNEDPKPTNLDINYSISTADQSKEMLSFEQDLIVSTFLPVQRVNRVIYYEPNSATTFNLKILEIPQSYYLNAGDHQFDIVMSNNRLPDWMSYNIVNNELYFTGTTPDNLEKTYSFIFMVQDKQTGLKSESINVDVSSSMESQVSNDKAVIIVVFLIFTGIVACVLLIVLISSKKQTTNSAVALQQTVNDNEKQRIDRTSTHVLSDSIINWNKKLIQRHKTKNYDFSETGDGNSSPMRVPGYAYEKFDDDSLEMSEENKSPIKMSDRLSEIQPDDDDGKKNDSDKSSFLDEIRFKFN